jgi:hypothetical protein
MTTTMDGAAILNLPMKQNDADATTIRGYLVALVRGVWHEGEDFSGKRPFGNSNWESEVYIALADAGVIEATRDEDGDVEWTDEEQGRGDALIRDAIDALEVREVPAANDAAPFGLTAEQEIRTRALALAVEVSEDMELTGAVLELAGTFAAWIATGVAPFAEVDVEPHCEGCGGPCRDESDDDDGVEPEEEDDIRMRAADHAALDEDRMARPRESE